MLIEINTDILQKFGITADDFLYLYLLHAKSYDCLKRLSLKPNTSLLQTKGLIKLGEELEDHIVRQTFLDMFQSSFDQMWSELLSHFPLKVYNNGQMRPTWINNYTWEKYEDIEDNSPNDKARITRQL